MTGNRRTESEQLVAAAEEVTSRPSGAAGSMTRKTWVLAGAAVLAVVIATGGVVVTSSGKPAASAAPDPPPNTVMVESRELSAMVSLSGTLTYLAGPDGAPYSVINQASGIYTELPVPGQVISQGQVLYRVNDSPVVLLYGSTPAYRTLSAGVSGPDVAELNADLIALGYSTKAQLSAASSFSFFGSATTTAVEKLQAALGMTQNGTLAVGQAEFEPTAVRVTILSAQLGGTSQSGQTVIQGSSTTRQVQVAVDASQQTDVAVGDTVTITLPNNQTTPGVVYSVGTVAACPSNSASSASSSTSGTPGTDTCSSGSSGDSTTPTITVDVIPSDPPATGTWDQAPVQVTVTTASVPRALVVPVTALLARSGGSYAVEVVDPGGNHHLVSVSLGLFDDADELVQVTGSGLAQGQEVVVPTV
jgi:peptidoglycan hydrolase-like protein with peptidoglycan-binding domain